jgi:hypothetical protein
MKLPISWLNEYVKVDDIDPKEPDYPEPWFRRSGCGVYHTNPKFP